MEDNQENNTEPTPRAGRPRRGRGRRFWLWTGLPLLAIGGAFIGRAWAHGGGCGHHSRTPEEMTDRMKWMVDGALSRVDASDEQHAAAGAIIERRAPELYAFRSEGRELKAALFEAVRSDDRAAVERIRKQSLSVLDRGSTVWVETINELSDLLTEDQRDELLAHLDRFDHLRR